jgi:hypothetical protein
MMSLSWMIILIPLKMFFSLLMIEKEVIGEAMGTATVLILIVNQVPFYGSLYTETSPFMNSSSFLLIQSPRPVPPYFL